MTLVLMRDPCRTGVRTMGTAYGTMNELRELRTEISGLRADMKRFIERANRQHIDTVVAGLKENYAGVVTGHQVETAKAGLSAHMVRDCTMQEQCYGLFMEFLESTAQHIRDGNVSDEIIRSYREQMKEMRSKGPFDRCDTCFTEVHRLFEKQVDLMKALGIYRKPGGDAGDAPGPADESVVRDVLEPVANAQRFAILQALMVQTRTFSEISQLTGLRGGNLLFHIRKLTDAGLILQRHERGDYIITDKGYRTMTAIARLHRDLNPA
jgi:DNA-binding transcriptional ArsR family regulator